MSNYRRLISYIYAYEGEVKGKNIGFVKLESRGGQCKLSVNVKKVYVGGSDLGVYLLAPGREISLGSIFIRGGAGEFRAVIPVENVADSGIGMDSCYGLSIHEPSDGWRCYTTIWEDAVAHAAEVELADVTSKSRRDISEEEEIHKKAEEIAAEMDREIAGASGGELPVEPQSGASVLEPLREGSADKEGERSGAAADAGAEVLGEADLTAETGESEGGKASEEAGMPAGPAAEEPGDWERTPARNQESVSAQTQDMNLEENGDFPQGYVFAEEGSLNGQGGTDAERPVDAQTRTAVEGQAYAEPQAAVEGQAYEEPRAAVEAQADAERQTYGENGVAAERQTAAETRVAAEAWAVAEGQAYAKAQADTDGQEDAQTRAVAERRTDVDGQTDAEAWVREARNVKEARKTWENNELQPTQGMVDMLEESGQETAVELEAASDGELGTEYAGENRPVSERADAGRSVFQENTAGPGGDHFMPVRESILYGEGGGAGEGADVEPGLDMGTASGVGTISGEADTGMADGAAVNQINQKDSSIQRAGGFPPLREPQFSRAGVLNQPQGREMSGQRPDMGGRPVSTAPAMQWRQPAGRPPQPRFLSDAKCGVERQTGVNQQLIMPDTPPYNRARAAQSGGNPHSDWQSENPIRTDFVPEETDSVRLEAPTNARPVRPGRFEGEGPLGPQPGSRIPTVGNPAQGEWSARRTWGQRQGGQTNMQPPAQPPTSQSEGQMPVQPPIVQSEGQMPIQPPASQSEGQMPVQPSVVQSEGQMSVQPPEAQSEGQVQAQPSASQSEGQTPAQPSVNRAGGMRPGRQFMGQPGGMRPNRQTMGQPGQPQRQPGPIPQPGQPQRQPGTGPQPNQPQRQTGTGPQPGQPQRQPGPMPQPNQPQRQTGTGPQPNQPQRQPGTIGQLGQPQRRPSTMSQTSQPQRQPGTMPQPNQPQRQPGTGPQPSQPQRRPGPMQQPSQPQRQPGPVPQPNQPQRPPSAMQEPSQPTPTPQSGRPSSQPVRASVPANAARPAAANDGDGSPQRQPDAGTYEEVIGAVPENGEAVREPVITADREELILGNPSDLERLEEEERESAEPQQIWDGFRKRYPKIQAFECAGECEILTIKPQDIGLLPRETWTYGNNSFLLHGYYNYRYLILAKVDTNSGTTRYLLGVPGNYYSNEKYMASMFGFPHFVLAQKQPTGNGRFGYWYTDIKLADMN